MYLSTYVVLVIDIFLQNMDPRLKKLRISTSVVKRCGKEKLSYIKEADMQRGKIEKM